MEHSADRDRRARAESPHPDDATVLPDRACAVTHRARPVPAEAGHRVKAAGPSLPADRRLPAAEPVRAEDLLPAEDPLRAAEAAQQHLLLILHRTKMPAAAEEMLLPARIRKTEKTSM